MQLFFEDLGRGSPAKDLAGPVVEREANGFIANPDLVERLRRDLPVADTDTATFYTGGETGCLTYLLHRYCP